jgi:hypothetical protein
LRRLDGELLLEPLQEALWFLCLKQQFRLARVEGHPRAAGAPINHGAHMPDLFHLMTALRAVHPVLRLELGFLLLRPLRVEFVPLGSMSCLFRL